MLGITTRSRLDKSRRARYVMSAECDTPRVQVVGAKVLIFVKKQSQLDGMENAGRRRTRQLADKGGF